jgi:Leucine-rich repeat (LRR) protein
LTELPEEIGTLTSLQIFKANNNKFKKVPKSIGQCSKLKELYIQENELTYLPNVENIKKRLQKLKYDI